MAIFKTADPDEKAQANAESALRSKRRDRDGLIERLGVAEAATASYRRKARALAGEGGDDAAIAKLEAQMRASQDRALTLTGAIADIDQVIAGLECEVEVIVDRRMRVATSAAVGVMADELAEAHADFTRAAERLEAAARQSGSLIPESRAVAEFTLSALTQLPAAVEMVTAALRQHALGVLAGHGSPSLPRPAPPSPKLAIVPPMPPDVDIFLLQNLKFVAANGEIVVCGKNKRHVVPRPLAEKALAEHLALPLSDKRIRDLEYGANPLQPSQESCAWLGTPAKAKPAPPKSAVPITHSAFEPMDRGKPYTVAIPRGPEPVAMGSRNAPDVDEG